MDGQEFIDELSKIASKLEKGDRFALLDLRKFIRPISSYEKHSSWKNKEEKFLLYFLKVFLDDFWRNLAVDTTHQVKDTDQVEIAKTIGKNIKNILSDTEKSNLGNGYIALSNMSASYFKLLHKIEEENT